MAFLVNYQSHQGASGEGILGKDPISLTDNVFNTTATSLTLNGKGVINYGEVQQENFVRMLENFASATAPLNPTIGQLWFNASDYNVYVCVDVTNANVIAAGVTPIQVISGKGWVKVASVDTQIAKLSVAQQFTARQRTTPMTSNNLSFDLSAANDFVCTPTTNGTLTFTNISAGCKGEILLTNNANYTISKIAAIKCSTSMLTTISSTGRYRLAYSSLDGTNVDVTASGALE